MASFREIFKLTSQTLQELKKFCHGDILNKIDALISQIEDKDCGPKEVLKAVIERPKPLKLYEPLVEEK